MVRITSCTTLGASPWLGSSNSIRPGPPTSAREIDTICNSPPDMFSHSRGNRCAQRREDVAARVGSEGAKGRALARDRQIARGGERWKHPPVVRHPSDARACDLVCRQPRHVAAGEFDAAAAGRRQSEDRPQQRGLARAARSQQRDDLARAHVERNAEEHLRFAIERLDVAQAQHAIVPSAERRTQGLSRNSSGVPRAIT